MIHERDLPETLIPRRVAPRWPSPYGTPGRTPVRIFYDTEFLEDGRTIDLISIGMVACTYNAALSRYLPVAEFYAVNRHAPWALICQHSWLVENVLPSLPGKIENVVSLLDVVYDRGFHIPPASSAVPATTWFPDFADPVYLGPDEIQAQVGAMITAGGEDVELWAWYGAYDHVALCQLWGAMVDKPAGVPMFTHDLKQEADRQGIALPDQPAGEHNALEDARHNVVRARALGVIW